MSRVETAGLPVGLFRSVKYSTQRVKLAAGDTLFLYTDGLSEAVSSADEEYGEARVARAVGEHYALDPPSLVRACVQNLASFRAGTRPGDDLTVMAIRRSN